MLQTGNEWRRTTYLTVRSSNEAGHCYRRSFITYVRSSRHFLLSSLTCCAQCTHTYTHTYTHTHARVHMHRATAWRSHMLSTMCSDAMCAVRKGMYGTYLRHTWFVSTPQGRASTLTPKLLGQQLGSSSVLELMKGACCVCALAKLRACMFCHTQK